MNHDKKYMDLHLHTRGSDGECGLEETIDLAKEAGLSAIAITDHNHFTIHAPMELGNLQVIPGAEFSTTYLHDDGQKTEVHIVGLFFDGVNRELEVIFKRFDKDAYVKALIKRLGELGIPITMEELRARNPESYQFARMQIADLIVEKGFATDRSNAMDLWIGNFSPYYMNSLDYIHYIDTEECVREICRYGGLPILAHPFHYKFSREQIEELVRRVRAVTEEPLGMEVHYGKYSEEQQAYLSRLAEQYGFLPSAGSDRHRREQEFVKGEYRWLKAMMEVRKGYSV